MNQRCASCGAELFEGQQFCRVCGAAVVTQGEATTQLLGDNGWPQPQGSEASGTSPVWGGAGTEPVGAGQQSPPAYKEPPAYQEPTGYQKTAAFQQPTAYHAPLASMQQTSPLSAPPTPRAGGRGVWFFALLVVFLLGAGVAGVGAFVWWKAQQQRVIVVKKGGPEIPGHAADIPEPPLPPDFGERLGEQIRKAVEAAGLGAPLDESGAVVSGDTTTLTKTYPLDGDATFAVHVMNGNITVSGSDGDDAEVKIIKRGGSAEERARARVMLAQTDEGLTFIGAPASGVEVSYEVKVPRGLHAVEIDADKGDVKISGFGGAVVSTVKKGNAEFRDVTGDVKSNVIKGETRVVFEGAEREGAQEFSVIKGNIEATLAEGTDADISATTTVGDINADDSLGLTVEKRPAGRALSGKLGDGGQALRFKVTNGDIKIKK